MHRVGHRKETPAGRRRTGPAPRACTAMELRRVRYFVAVAEELHFRRAAERLHLAQPALSQQVRKLEVELGVELLHRTKRDVALTSAGAVFLDEARRLLRQADEAARTARNARTGAAGRL